MRLTGLVKARLHLLLGTRYVSAGVACIAATALVFGMAVTAATQSAGPSIMVYVTADGQSWEYISSLATVGDILKEAGVEIGPKDRVIPPLKTKSAPRLKIRIIRIQERVVVQSEPIAFKTIAKFNPYSRGGRVVLSEGVRGEKQVTYLVTCKDGVNVGHKVRDAVVTRNPQNEVISVSRGMLLASRGVSVSRTLRMSATAYAPFSCGGSRSGRAACGLRAGKGIVAVDPRVVALGTRLYVEGYGYCLAGDTGGAIKGNRIDLGFDTYREALRFGRRYVTVHILR